MKKELNKTGGNYKLRFPLPNVNVEIIDYRIDIKNPLFDDGFFCVNQNEISIEVEKVARYYIRNGSTIKILPAKNSNHQSIEHFLNRWGVVSILHQRKIINFHSSSFILNGIGIMVCGDSGAGKSSLAAAFSFSGAKFISDDISPVIFQDKVPMLQTIPNYLALSKDTVKQLKLENKKVLIVNELNNKYEYGFTDRNNTLHPFLYVLWLNVYEGTEVRFQELELIDKFTMLRGEICGWDMLKGMKATEADYMKQLAKLSRKIKIIRILRPVEISIESLASTVRKYLSVKAPVYSL